MKENLDTLHLQFLEASYDLLQKQEELLQHLADLLLITPYDYWVKHISLPKTSTAPPNNGELLGEWRWFFHGLECDFKNHVDGRLVRVDFAIEKFGHTISSFGVMTACPPWKQYPELRAYFANEKKPPYNELSGEHAKMVDLYEDLIELGYFELSDKELVLLSEKYTNKVTDKNLGEINVTRIPPELMPENEMDVVLCHRMVLSKKAFDKIDTL